MKDDYDDDEALEKFGEEIGLDENSFGDIFNGGDEIEEVSETRDTDDLLNDLLQEIGQDFGGLGRMLSIYGGPIGRCN